jgi:hypothetical protein
VLAPLGVVLVDRLPLPGVHPEVFAPYVRDSGPLLSLFSLGLHPAMNAALLVEIAALVVPRWRPLRHSAGRARLERATVRIAIVLAAIQAFFLIRWMDGNLRPFPGLQVMTDTLGARLVIGFSIVTGAALLIGLARILSVHGVGCGFSVLLAALSVPDIVKHVSGSLDHASALDGGLLAAFGVPAVALVLLALVTARARADAASPFGLPTPSSAILPLSLVAALSLLPRQLAAFASVPAPIELLGTDIRAQLVVLALAVLALAWILSRPSLIAPVWRRAFAAPPDAARAFRRGLAASLVFLGALYAISAHLERARIALDVLPVLVLLCVGLDLASELRFRRAQGDVIPVRPEHRLYAVGPALARLDRAGIAAFPRGLRHRALLGFFGPYIPVELLVPAPRAAEARAALDEVFG